MDAERLLKILRRNPDLLDKRKCETTLHHFIQRFWRQLGVREEFVDNWHIKHVCEHLEAVTNGENKRLIINIPPRHMKTLSVVAWQAWTWAQPQTPGFPLRGPSVRFLTASYAPNPVRRDNNTARRVILSNRYQNYWGERVILTRDQNTVTRYDNTEGGFRYGASTRGALTGEGGEIIIVDDPIDPKKAYASEPERVHVLEWWRSVMSSRLNNPRTGAIVIIMQRLHDQDLTGYLLKNEPGWTHLCIPARYEEDHPHPYAGDPRTTDGELLWPERIPEEFLHEREEGMGSYHAAGQLQQRPSPRKGGLFERGWFNPVAETPARAIRVRAWDFAGTRKPNSPYTVGMLMSRVRNRFTIEHVKRFRGTPHQVKQALIQTAEDDGKDVIIDFPQDPGQSGKFQAQDFAGELAGFNVRYTPETGSKTARAEPFSAQCEAGNVDYVDGDYARNMLDEFELFPNSNYKDQVDAASRGFARLARRKLKRFAGPILVTADTAD